MMRKAMTFLLVLFTLSGSVMDLKDDGRQELIEVEKNVPIKKRWIGLKIYRRWQALVKRLKEPFHRRLRRWFLIPYILTMNGIDALAKDSSEWARAVPAMDLCNRPQGCWHTVNEGATKEAYSSALYSEAWGSDVTKAFDVTQNQSIVTNVTPSASSGSILLKRSTDTIFTINFLAGNITVNGGATIDTYTAGTEITIQFIPDMVEETVVIYIDGVLLSKEDFAGGEHCNQFDEVARSGTFTAVGDVKVSDSMDNLPIHFYDTLNEDTLSDYTLGGATNPTYDSTEKAIKLYDNTNLANRTSTITQTINSPQDNMRFKFNFMIDSNDTSTDDERLVVWLRSASDTDTGIYIKSYGANSFLLRNRVDGVTSGTSTVVWTPLVDTWYEIEIIIDLEGTVTLFIDGVETNSITCTKLKRFYDGQFYAYARHDAGEVSEVYVKNILIEDLPTVNAPRSTPPGLMTSGLRPATEGTFWDNLAGYWSNSTAPGTNGIYGNSIDASAVAQYSGPTLNFDTDIDITSYHTFKFAMESTATGSWSWFFRTSAGNTYRRIFSISTANKKEIFEFTIPPGGSWSVTGTPDPTAIEYIGLYAPAGTPDIMVSDIQFLGGPEHDIRGQPLYSSPGIDDIDEWDTSDSTTVAPTWDTDHYDLDDPTNGANEVCSLKRSLNFNPNGVGHLHWEAEIQATDTSTEQFGYWIMALKNTANSRDECKVQWEDNLGTPRIIVYLKSNNVINYSSNYNIAKDNLSHTFDIFFHKTYGFALFMDDELIISDTSITGSWVDWSGDYEMRFHTRHDAGERSDVLLHEIGFDRHPLNIHQYQSNELEELTDTLAPSGTDYMDGDWNATNTSVQNTGNPVTNLKFIRETGIADTGEITYDLDLGADLRRMDRTRVWVRGSNAGNYNLVLRTSAGNDRLSANYALTADTWTLIDLEDIIDASWGNSGAGTLNPSSVATFAVQNNSGGASNVDVYGLQFLSSEYSTENFVPQKLVIEEGVYIDGTDKITCPDFIGTGGITSQIMATIDTLGGTSGRFIDDGQYFFYTTDTNDLFGLSSNNAGDFSNANFNTIDDECPRNYTSLRPVGGNNCKHYKGALDVTGTIDSGTPVNGGAVIIGNRSALNRPLNGFIHSLLVYERLLSRFEIAWNYHHPKDPVKGGLVLQLDPDEISGSSWSDLSGNSNDGTISGASTKRGTLYMGPGEKARLYKLEINGHLWTNQTHLTFLDLWDAGLKGIGTWQSDVFQLTIENESNAENNWTFDGGVWELVRANAFGEIVTKNDAVVFLNQGSYDGTPAIEDNGCVEVQFANYIRAYCGADTSDSSLFKMPPSSESFQLSSGVLTIDGGHDRPVVNTLRIDSGCTFRVADGYEFYYRKLDNNGTIMTGGGYDGTLKKYGRYSERPPLDKNKMMSVDTPAHDAAHNID